jgi:hypothetical protein
MELPFLFTSQTDPEVKALGSEIDKITMELIQLHSENIRMRRWIGDLENCADPQPALTAMHPGTQMSAGDPVL